MKGQDTRICQSLRIASDGVILGRPFPGAEHTTDPMWILSLHIPAPWASSTKSGSALKDAAPVAGLETPMADS